MPARSLPPPLSLTPGPAPDMTSRLSSLVAERWLAAISQLAGRRRRPYSATERTETPPDFRGLVTALPNPSLLAVQHIRRQIAVPHNVRRIRRFRH
jgi:hypothetical protein